MSLGEGTHPTPLRCRQVTAVICTIDTVVVTVRQVPSDSLVQLPAAARHCISIYILPLYTSINSPPPNPSSHALLEQFSPWLYMRTPPCRSPIPAICLLSSCSPSLSTPLISSSSVSPPP